MIAINNLSRLNKLIFKKSNLYVLLLITLIFTFDRLTKNLIINNFIEKTLYLNDFINLDLIWNIGLTFDI